MSEMKTIGEDRPVFSLSQNAMITKQIEFSKKLDLIKRFKENQDQEFRQSSIDFQDRWNVIRDQRSQQQKKYEKIVKFNAKRREFISHIQLQQMIVKLLNNFKVKKAQDRHMVLSIFLAIKIIVKFNYGHKGKYGQEQNHRLKNYSRRIFTINALMMNRIAESKSRVMLCKFLHRQDTFVKFKLKTKKYIQDCLALSMAAAPFLRKRIDRIERLLDYAISHEL